jgi:hypothetical protein
MKCYGYEYSKGDESPATNTPYFHADFILTDGSFDADFGRSHPHSISNKDNLYYNRCGEGIQKFFTDSEVKINHEVFSSLAYQSLVNDYTSTLTFKYENVSAFRVHDRIRAFASYVIDDNQDVTLVSYSITRGLKENSD